jgi:hypothetical protein
MKKLLILVLLLSSFLLVSCNNVKTHTVTIHVSVAKPGFQVKYIKVVDGLLLDFTPQEFSGYQYIGLYEDENYLNVYNNSRSVHNDFELYAKYIQLIHQINLHVYDGNVQVIDYLDNSSIPIPTCPINYTFSGWYLDSNFINVLNTFSTDLFEITDLYAKFILAYVEVEFVYISYDDSISDIISEQNKIEFKYLAPISPDLLEVIKDPVTYYELTLQGSDLIPFPTDFLSFEGYTFVNFVLDNETNYAIAFFNKN